VSDFQEWLDNRKKPQGDSLFGGEKRE
jgi:hypothetical protein